MRRATQGPRHLPADDTGATAVEYVLLVVAIAIVIVAALFAFGSALQTRFSGAASCVSTGVTPSGVSC